MRVYVLSLGDMDVEENDLISVTNKEESKVISIPTWALLIEHQNGKILFDTGRKDHELLKKELLKCNVVPEQIDTVVLSHLHFDHAGNIDLFKNATIYVQNKELEECINNGDKPYNRGAYVKNPMILHNKWKIIDGEYRLIEGVTLIPFYGHTKGLQGMLIELKHQNILVCSDACYTSRNLGPPIIHLGFLNDIENYDKNLKKIQKIKKEKNAWIMYGHDPEQFSELKKIPYYYE